MQEFPCWKHHPEHGARLVKDKKHLESLGSGWGDDSSVWRKHLLRDEPAAQKVIEIAEEPKLGRKNASKKVS